MKSILEFNLPEEREEFDTAVQGAAWKNVCWEFNQYLSEQSKHGPETLKVSDITSKFWEIVDKNDVEADF